MSAPKRSPIQRERDKTTIIELTLKGWTQRQIADHLEVDAAIINRELKKIKEEWRKEKLEDADLHIKQELRRLSMLEAEYWRGWERSQGNKESVFSERLATGRDDLGQAIGRIKTATRTETLIGDVQFLNGIAKVIESRVRLLGIAPAPPKQMKVLEAMQVLLDEGVALPDQAEIVHKGIVNMEEELKKLPQSIDSGSQKPSN